MPFTLGRRLRRVAAGALCAAAVALPLQLAGTAFAGTATTSAFTPIKLQNGWTGGVWDAAKPAVRAINGIVTLKGDIATSSANTNPVAFTLPKAFRPAASVWVPVILCAGASGRLYIQPDGVVSVQVENAWAAAQCMTSLDGVSFAKSGSSFTALKAQDGWTGGAYGAAKLGARVISGIVHLRGAAYSSSTSPIITVLPKADRPAVTVDVKADLCGAQNGRLLILPNGTVEVQAENSFSSATCFTSFDGVAYARSASSATALKLQNGWKSLTSEPAVRNVSGVVTLSGNMGTTVDAAAIAFTLPKADRPSSVVYLPVDMCHANSGQMEIDPSGKAIVYPENGTYANAGCLTSLDGLSFAR
jgi:hypothetical protein